MKNGDSIANAIVIDAKNSITSITEEHKYISQLSMELQIGIETIEQKLIIENGRLYDVLTLRMGGGSERIMCFNITALFVKNLILGICLDAIK